MLDDSIKVFDVLRRITVVSISVTCAAKATAQETSERDWVIHDSFARSDRNCLKVSSLERGINFEMYLC
jgi:hypothetical protein